MRASTSRNEESGPHEWQGNKKSIVNLVLRPSRAPLFLVPLSHAPVLLTSFLVTSVFSSSEVPPPVYSLLNSLSLPPLFIPLSPFFLFLFSLSISCFCHLSLFCNSSLSLSLTTFFSLSLGQFPLSLSLSLPLFSLSIISFWSRLLFSGVVVF